MTRVEPKSGASGTKHKCTTLFTVQEIIDSLVDIDQLEEDYDHPESDLKWFLMIIIDLDRSCDSSGDEEVNLAV